MNILLLAHFVGDRDVEANNRFDYLADFLTQRGHDVNLITSNYSHVKKSRRDERGLPSLPYQRTLIEEPPYYQNVSLRRIKSHQAFAHNVGTYLDSLPSPDVVYCAVPSLDLADTARAFCGKRGVPLVVDVNDLWPEAFSVIIPSKLISDLIFRSEYRRALQIYRSAEAVVSVSQTYADHVACLAGRPSPEVVFLGTDLAAFDGAACGRPAINFNGTDGRFRLGYCGTIGHNYDLDVVLDAITLLSEAQRQRLDLIVMGDGPLKGRVEAKAISTGSPVLFLGRLPYPEMVATLCRCSASINPIIKGAAGSIINKHGDYAAAGIPVINTQDSAEYCALVDRWKMGINCLPSSAENVSRALSHLMDNPEKVRRMGQQARACAQAHFDRKKTYPKLCALIEDLVPRGVGSAVGARP